MSFGAPQNLAFLILPVILLGVLRWDLLRQNKNISQIIQPKLWSRMIPGWRPQARLNKAKVFCFALFFAFIALARPQLGEREETIRTTGIDVMLVLDVSRSMDVEDVMPSRIKKARHWIRSFLGRMGGNRVGVVAFASSTYVACPLTTDLDYVLESVDILGPEMILNQGTDIGLALKTALQAIERGAENGEADESKQLVSKAVVLISDGEDHEAAAEEAASQLRKRGVSLFVLGVGSEQGGPIPIRDDTGRLTGYKRSGSDQVVSRFNSRGLEEIAAASGGKYWNVSQSESEIDQVLSDLGALEQTRSQERIKRVPIERFQWPLALAVLLFVFELAIPLVTQVRSEKRVLHQATAIGIAAGLLLVGLIATVSESSAAPIESYLKNQKGLKKFESEQTDEAERDFADAQAADPNQVVPRFNLGVAQMKKGDSKSAIHSFESSARSAGMSGDAELLAQSLYNLGSAYEKDKQNTSALRSFANAVRMAEFAKNEKLAIEARKRIQKLEEQNQKNQNQQGGGGGGSQGEQKDQKESKEQGDKNQDQKNQAQGQQQFEDPSVSRRRQFKSEKLSPEDSERVMNELSSREKQLQAKLKRQRGSRQSSNNRDW